MEARARGARDDPQMKSVIKTLKEITEQIQQSENPTPHPKKQWKGRHGCYYCGEQGHWRKSQRKRKASEMAGGSSTPQPDTKEKSSAAEKGSVPATTSKKGGGKPAKLPSRPQYYNPDPVARLFGRANEAPVEINGIPTTSLVDTGATVTIINANFCGEHGLEIHSLDGLVAIAVTGGFNV